MATTFRRSKFNNVKTFYKNVKYDSKAEAKYAEILENLLKEGKIKSIERQVKYPLEDRNGGHRLRYVADFVVTDNNDKKHVLDVKGVLLPATNIKLAYLRYVYHITVDIIPTTGLKKFNLDWLN